MTILQLFAASCGLLTLTIIVAVVLILRASKVEYRNAVAQLPPGVAKQLVQVAEEHQEPLPDGAVVQGRTVCTPCINAWADSGRDLGAVTHVGCREVLARAAKRYPSMVRHEDDAAVAS